MTVETIRLCKSCSTPYDWKKSTSRYLKMTFDTDTCERRENGGTIDDFLAIERIGLFGFPIEELIGRVGK